MIIEYYLVKGMLKKPESKKHVKSIMSDWISGKLYTSGKPFQVINGSVDKPAALRKHKWDGVGEPAAIAIISPLLPPPILAQTESAMEDYYNAIAKLT